MRRKARNSAYVEFGGRAQDKILHGYRTRFNLTPEEASNLHMFFSPTRVPKGLTEQEVREVLRVYPERDSARQKTNERLLLEAGQSNYTIPASRSETGKDELHTIQNPPSFVKTIKETILPAELVQERMTRGNFRRGMEKLQKKLSTG